MEEYIINNMINLHNKIAHPLYYNGYISMDERVEIREYINTLEQALNEIKEYINNENYKDETIWVGDLIPILQIIDKVGGNE